MADRKSKSARHATGTAGARGPFVSVHGSARKTVDTRALGSEPRTGPDTNDTKLDGSDG